MYVYPMYPPKPPRTPEGLKWTQVAFVIYMATLGLQLATSVLIATILAGVGPTSDPFAIAQAVLSVFALFAVTFILGIVVLVFYFIGFGYSYGGRSEFSAAHTRNLSIALFTVIAAVVVAPIGAVVTTVLGFGAFFSFLPPDPVTILNTVMLTTVVGMGFNLVVAVLAAATLVLAVRAIAAPSHNVLLLVAAGIGCVTPAAVGGLTIWQISQLTSLFDAGFTSVGAGIPGVLGSALGLLTIILFFIVYRGVANRIRTGELKPTVPPPVAVPMVPMVPVYPYPMAPPPAPPPTPPTAPPSQNPPP